MTITALAFLLDSRCLAQAISAEVQALIEGAGAKTPMSINDQAAEAEVRSVFVLPGETVSFEWGAKKNGSPVSWITEGGLLVPVASNRWVWHAPSRAGHYGLRFLRDGGGVIQVNAFVMVPFRALRGAVLNGYRIGKYPKRSPYELPKGFIEVTEANQDTLVSPHFRIRQFLCKQRGSFPKYLVLDERLISKLELILERAREKGFSWTTFRIMSAYRTPYYNRAFGKLFSRHQWGDAVDLMVDQFPKDGLMDDLNGDGRSDVRDSLVLRDLVEEMEHEASGYFPVGGMGIYSRSRRHGSFVHVDARGVAARWGHRGRMAGKSLGRRAGTF